MVQKKGQKSNAKLQPSLKGKDGMKLNSQLREIGLRIVNITADGNCFFRAVADQLEGNEEEHLKYRKMVVDFIEAHRKDFEPFLEDDVPFEDYVKSMREVSTWAGNMELQAVSLLTHSNICIHRLFSPRWHIQNFKSTEARCIHLSYHNDEHYNSIRRIDDSGDGPAKPILLETPLDNKMYVEKTRNEKHSGRTVASIKKQQILKEKETEEEKYDHFADVNDELQAQLDCAAEGNDAHAGASALRCGGDSGEDMENMSHSNGLSVSKTDGHILQQDVKRTARNKACPCGSKKKYKACCGMSKVQNRSPQIASSVTKGLSNKARKEMVRSSKDIRKPKLESTKDSLNFGFLCI